MKKQLLILILIFSGLGAVSIGDLSESSNYYLKTDLKYDDVFLESWTYMSDFEDRTLGAWAAYPLWQDTAYDPNFRTNEIIPGDSNVSIVQKVTPFTDVDSYAGAQKLLDMYLVPESEVRVRYFLKTHQDAEYFKVRFAAGELGKIDVTIEKPEKNKWVWVNLNFDDFVRENPALAGKDRVKIYALAFLAKIPKADSKMPFYLGLDDIVFRGARSMDFRFTEPVMHKLPEFKPHIPESHYYRGDSFHLSGQWPLNAQSVSLEITNLTDKNEVVYQGELNRSGDSWKRDINLDFPEGLYHGTLIARDGTRRLSDTEFTIHIAPRNIGGKHPRLYFDNEDKEWVVNRFQKERFHGVYEEILERAIEQRERVPIESLNYDLDQFPDEDWLPTWSAWGSRIYQTGEAVKWNGRAYAFHEDREAGEYVKDVLLTLAEWPDFAHPWQTKRGRFSEHRTGRWSHPIAEAYDLTYDLMTPDERTKIRQAFMDNIIRPGHRTYVYNDNIIPATSNWIAHVLGGTLMLMSAIFNDGPETENLEPYFTGAMLKFYKFIERSTDSVDGAYGEGLGYYSSSMSNLVEVVPSLKNVFNIDVTDPLDGTYNEYIWGGPVKDNRWFEFGQSGSSISSERRSNWAFLLDMQQDPRLGWYYNHLKERETFWDVLFETDDVPRKDPFSENPVKLFREIGTTVFKSGWESDDLIFTMRTGPFYNHQHHDQGAFWFSDRGEVFIKGTRSISESGRYNDPLFESFHIQPISKSTILIDDNHQSQRIGDHLNFAPGFDNYGFVDHFLDGEDASFSTGDIGRLYWGKVESLQRNVLYLKPGIILMLDTVVPGEKDRDITLLYHTDRLDDIHSRHDVSTISRDNGTLNIMHLSPDFVQAEAVSTPHFLRTLNNVRPLERSGMLTVTARTGQNQGYPLVMANLFATTGGESPDVTYKKDDGFIHGVASGRNFAFNTKPGRTYEVENMVTDALALTWNTDRLFVSMAKTLMDNRKIVIQSDEPVTFERSDKRIRYYRTNEGIVTVGVSNRPTSVQLNGSTAHNVKYDSNRGVIEIRVAAGEGEIVIE